MPVEPLLTTDLPSTVPTMAEGCSRFFPMVEWELFSHNRLFLSLY